MVKPTEALAWKRGVNKLAKGLMTLGASRTSSLLYTPRAGLKGKALELGRTKKPVLHAPFLMTINIGAAHLEAVVRQEAWRFMRGVSPHRERPNQPPIPSVAVVEEAYSRTK
jgi:hypothetical protein